MSYPNWLHWLAGTLLPLALLWLLWQLALRPEHCYRYNRVLLLLAPVVAAAWPLLPHPVLPAWWSPAAGTIGTGAAVLLPALAVGPATGTAASRADACWPVLLGLYAVGVGVGLVRLAYRYGQLRRVIRRLPRERRPGYVLAYTGGQLPTSSFGSVVLWDEIAGLTPAEAAPVLAHELAHVRQGHSYDVLWLELWRVLLWPNPFAHLLLPALRLTHELLADHAAALAAPASTATPAAYPALLARLAARQALGASYYSLLQPFTFSFTLTRIAMLQSKNPVRRWKQWLVLPLLGGLFLAAGESAAQTTLPPPPPPKMMPPSAKPDDKDKVYTYVEQMPQLPGKPGMRSIIEAIQASITYPAKRVEGRVFAKFTVGADGKVRDLSIVKGLNDAADAAVLQAIRQLPIFVPGKQSGKAVAVSFTVPVNFTKK